MERRSDGRPGRRPARVVTRAAVPVLAAVLLAAGCETSLVAPGQPASPASQGSLLRGATLFVEGDSHALRQMQAWQASRPADAREMGKIASASQAVWFGDWTADVRRAVSGVVAAARADGTVAVLVAYNIPQRDCGLHSAGGARDGPAYLSWIREFARGLSGGPAVVILEPDAVAGVDCLSHGDHTRRLDLMAEAVRTLAADGAAVYVDAGHAHWKSATEMAGLLRAAGIDGAAGFALNVSNYHSTAANIRYGEAVSGLLGGARFVIDTSRNGIGTTSAEDWCNAPGQALGAHPRTETGHRLVDAFLWIKRPGESDGTCNGGPRAGEWWPDYALELARRQPIALAGP